MTQFQNQILHFVQDDNSTSVILSRSKNLFPSYLVQYSDYSQNESLPASWFLALRLLAEGAETARY